MEAKCSSGRIIGGSGGHSDTAAGARLPIVIGRVIAVSTPGNTVDLLVTERVVAVNPSRPELPVFSIHALRHMALSMTGVPGEVRPQGRIVAEVEYRDVRIIDRIRAIE